MGYPTASSVIYCADIPSDFGFNKEITIYIFVFYLRKKSQLIQPFNIK